MRGFVRFALETGMFEEPSQKLLFRDDFTEDVAAGAVNLTLGSDGKTVRHAVDPNSHMSVASGALMVSGLLASGANDFKPGLWYDAMPRAGFDGKGLVLLSKVTIGAQRGPDWLGWYLDHLPTGAGPIGNEYGVRFVSTNIYASVLSASTKVNAGAYTAGDVFYVAVVIKPLSNELWVKGGEWVTWTRVHTDTTRTTAYLYPTSSYYMPITATTSLVDNFVVAPYVNDNFDNYFNVGSINFVGKRVLLFGDSKSTPLIIPGAGSSAGFRFYECPLRFATAGATVASRKAAIDANIAAAVGTPEAILWNLGVNDADSLPSESTWKTNAQYCIDAFQTTWPSVPNYFMRVYGANQVANCNTINGWYADLVASNPASCFLGPDERLFLPGNLVDDRHPTNPAGYALEWAQWRSVFGY